jgi:HSP20 family protein
MASDPVSPAQKGEEIMAKKDKHKDGAHVSVRTAGAKALARTGEPTRLPARATEHPLRWLRQEMDAVFDRFFSRWPGPSEWGLASEWFWDVDVQDTDKEVVVRAEAPGFEAGDFDIQVSGNTLTIRAEHKHEAEKEQEGYRYTERRFGRYQRSIPLPAAVQADKAEAHYRNGVLELRLPMTEDAQRRRIEVKG